MLAALAAHEGELRRNDYRRLVSARAELNASLGPELVFGFGSAAPPGLRYVELLTEVARVEIAGCWAGRAGSSPAAPLAEPGEAPADAALLS